MLSLTMQYAYLVNVILHNLSIILWIIYGVFSSSLLRGIFPGYILSYVDEWFVWINLLWDSYVNWFIDKRFKVHRYSLLLKILTLCTNYRVFKVGKIYYVIFYQTTQQPSMYFYVGYEPRFLSFGMSRCKDPSMC